MWHEAKKKAFIFPGQGSQTVGMGSDFYDQYPEVRELYDQASALLGYDIANLMFEGPEEDLTKTVNAQTAIYLHSVSILRIIKIRFPDLIPDFTAGHSLGEYSALTAAGYLPFQQGIQLVHFRGKSMQEACALSKGTMAAILGLDATEIEKVVKEVNMPNDLWAANYNCPGQVVISGTEEGVNKGIEIAKVYGAKKGVILKVSGGFHSGLMASAEKKLAEKLDQLPLSPSNIPVVMNVTAQPETDPAKIKPLMSQQVTSPVRWEQSVRTMDKAGVDFYLEIGAPKTLTGMMKRIGVNGTTLCVNTVGDLEQLEKTYVAK